jgi:hypothetical protein
MSMKRYVVWMCGCLLAGLLAAGLYAQNTVLLTNTQYNAEGTGNVLTLTDKAWFPAATLESAPAASVSSFNLPTTAAHAVPTTKVGSNVVYATLDYADSASLSAQLAWLTPADWTSTVDARLIWFTTATSGNVVWQVSTICVADAETSDPALNTASTVTDAAKGTTLQFNEASITGVTITGCAAGEVMFIKVLRDSAHASDTLAATARLVGVELTYRRAI